MTVETNQLISSAIEWGFFGITNACLVFAVSYLRSINRSIEHLNQQVAVILVKSEEYERRFAELSQRLSNLEASKAKR
jgi:hypothetical protein